MSELTYKRMLFEDDTDIPQLITIHQTPEIARYLSISDNYFSYVTNTENVYFYKVYEDSELIGSTHIEKQGTTLFENAGFIRVSKENELINFVYHIGES